MNVHDIPTLKFNGYSTTSSCSVAKHDPISLPSPFTLLHSPSFTPPFLPSLLPPPSSLLPPPSSLLPPPSSLLPPPSLYPSLPGDDELVIESTLLGTFTIRANVDTDSADQISQKVSNVTKVSAHNLCLYTR